MIDKNSLLFDKDKFAKIIKQIKEQYDSQEDFAKKASVSRTYLSQYMNQYQIKVRKYENIRIISEKDINENPFPKRFIELMIKDILSSNPNIGRFKDTFIILDKKEKIVINQSLSFDYYSGFKFELVDTDQGVYMNLALGHKFIRTENILEFMKKF